MGKIEKSDLKSGFGNQLRLVVSEGRAGQGVGVGVGRKTERCSFSQGASGTLVQTSQGDLR